MRLCRVVFLPLVALLVGVSLAAEPVKVEFKKMQLDPKFRSEGVAAADFNNDGQLDVAAGFVWYEAPSWKMHTIVEETPEYEPKGYSNSFCTFADDLNHDGWQDIMVVDFPSKQTWWFENPGKTGGLWDRHVCTPVSNNESPTYVDVDGDGKRELLMGVAPDSAQSDGPHRRMAFLKPDADPYKPWHIYPISEEAAPGTKKYSHGLGLGDLNGDGRQDVLVAEGGWWEQPVDPTKGPWKFHAADFGGKAAQMLVYDYDGDGDNDVITSSPHAFGIWWYEQKAPNVWQKHDLDSSFSQVHAMCLADINGDGLADFVTGKRWWAHAKGDPGVDEPAVFFWFELVRKNGKASWIPHQFDHDSGVGTQFEVVDMNGDNLLDIIASNKKGVHYFEQVRK